MARVQNNPEYADPVIREPSPISSVGSIHGPDQTSLSDSEGQLDQWAFERKWNDRLELGRATREEELANIDPLITRPTTAIEERILFERILRNLRAKIAELEDDELFEQALLRGSQAGLEDYTIPTDIDALMQGMMLTTNASGTTTLGPWNHGPLRFDTSLHDTNNDPPSPPPPRAAKRTRAKGKSRR
ncbi:hypothetical protein MIND_00821900 [Mycena indigotica]|uniref:Uncharacterized protein n=1 Tax=Mycena indigotica TaxID=2126181 RepID=A0A8H6SG25_9AGAR|nr:uncharacterized protein MIND_00821900 [Mycena indigotica]KAF7298744.1 hypothetical protein MIND_00821900 [Mycena indigotica]